MAGTTPCVPCCRDTQTVNVPGVEGPPGGNGTNGKNAYTTTTADFTVPAIGGTVTVNVVNSDWMANGQIVVADGPATFLVQSAASSTTATLQFLGYTGDVSVGSTIASGSTISPGGVAGLASTLSVYGSGTAYAVTATPALAALGTTTPSLTITSPGKWAIFARARYDYAAATFAAVRDVTTKLRRTNNTATDIANATTTWKTQIITTLTFTANDGPVPPVIYTTANNNDVIELWTSVSVVPSAGALNVVEAEIVAIKLS